MSKEKKVTEEPDTTGWMATYTDLMTLLLTFFVLLLSMSTIDQQKKKVALNSLIGAFGFKPGAQSIIGSSKGMNITSGTAPMIKEDVQFENLRNAFKKTDLEYDLDIIKENQRIIITLKNRILFEYGASRINPKGLEFLSELAGVIKDGPRRIELRGYATFSETIFKQDPLNSAMILSAGRAFSVLIYLKEKEGIPVKKIVAHGFGINPRRGGNRKKDEEFNRQVKIILDYRENIPFGLRMHRKKGAVLDYNGFLFRTQGDENE